MSALTNTGLIWYSENKEDTPPKRGWTPPVPNGPGGIGGGGLVWSSYGQWIEIKIGTVSTHTWVNPGWNNVQFWIPFIFPEPVWIDAMLLIEASGYLLIPAGFEFYIKIAENAPPPYPNNNMVDKISIHDLYDVEIISAPVPTNPDFIEDVTIQDDYIIDIISTDITNANAVEDVSYEDVYDAYAYTPGSGDYVERDLVEVEDVYNADIIHTTITNNTELEDVDIIDENVIDIIHTTVTENPKVEDAEFIDVHMVELIQALVVSGTVDDITHISISGLGAYMTGDNVTLTAVPEDGWEAGKWYVGGIEVASGNTYEFVILQNTAVYLTSQQGLSAFDTAVNADGSQLRFTVDSYWYIYTGDWPGTLGMPGGVRYENYYNSEISTVADRTGNLSFDWYTQTGSPWNEFRVLVNGTAQFIRYNNTQGTYSSIPVNSGDTIVFRCQNDMGRNMIVGLKNVQII